MSRTALLLLTCGLLAAQQTLPPASQPPRTPPAEEPPSTTIRVGVTEVVAPVLVFDRSGTSVDGLRPDQFRLYDNGKEQNIHVDVTFIPISMVIAIQANANVEKILPQVSRVGNMIAPEILGNNGEASVIAYDSRIRTLQEFTADSDKITAAVKKIYPGSTSNRMVDAVEAGINQLRTRPKDRRRVLLLIGETRDVASEAKPRETLIALQVNNIEFYSVDMSRLISTLTAPVQPARQSTLPPAMYPIPSNVAATPTSVQQTFGTGEVGRAEFIPLMVEIFKDVKAIFKANPVELFTKGTGGTQFGFYRQRGLEEAIQRIGEELHSQYMVTYSPNNKEEGGFHEITAEVLGHPDYKLRIRPGYWVATSQ
jgi:VWFA-related protein